MASRRSHVAHEQSPFRDTSNFNAPIAALDDGCKTFGIPISVIMKRPDHANEKVPLVVKYCCQALHKNAKRYLKGIYTHGIFRESGALERVNFLKEVFDTKGKLSFLILKFSFTNNRRVCKTRFKKRLRKCLGN